MSAAARSAQVKKITDGARGLPHGDRARFIASSCGADQQLLADVLQSLTRGDETLDNTQELESTAAPSESLDGQQLGAYRVIRRIGRGGMGAVFLGVRADEQFQRRVAIKLVHPGFDDGHMIARFENERRTLAVLDHPNIVKLLDGGTSPSGLPYFVMEYVEGEAVDRYCDRQNCSVEDRLRLFRKICSAVHYAHQNLIVHRDLKPSNIMITAAGEPKVLDFGIAKLLRPEFGAGPVGLTYTNFQPMTPEYASPEQLQGRPITTASDVYALGVLLYRVLTGHHPFEGHTRSMGDLEHAVCELDPERPSTVMRRDAPPQQDRRSRHSSGVHPDLDVIVFAAMRKEPQNRYASADHLAQDIDNYLAGRPVQAREQTLVYRLRKLVGRHRAGFAAGAVAVLALLAATVTATWYANVAHRERVRAEHRLNDVRSLTAGMFSLDDAARSGSTAARERAVLQMLPVLARLGDEPDADPGLLTQIVEAYIRIGDLEGNPYGPNLGNAAAARQSYERARQLADRLAARDPALGRRELARTTMKLADITSFERNQQEALKLYREALATFESMSATDPANAQLQRDTMRALEATAFTQYRVDDLAGALASYERYLRTADQVYRAEPGSTEARAARAKAEARIGEILVRSGRPEGLAKVQAAFAVLSSLSVAEPANLDVNRAIAAAGAVLGEVLASSGKAREGAPALEKAIGALERMLQQDPENVLYRRDLALAMAYLASVRTATGDRPGARQMTVRALGELQRLADRPGAAWHDHNTYAWLLLTTAEPDLRDVNAARRHADAAARLSSHSDPGVLNTLAMSQEAAGDVAGALETVRRALSVLPPQPSGHDSHTSAELQHYAARLERRLSGGAAAAPAPQAH